MKKKFFHDRSYHRGARRRWLGPGLIGALAGFLVLAAAYGAPSPTKKPPSTNFDQWAELVAAARKEGGLIVNFGRSGARVQGPMFKAFQKRFGIKVTIGRGSGRNQINRMLAERRGGLYKVDVLATGLSSLLQRMAPSGALEPVKNLLFHPEVIDKSLWRDGIHRYADEEQKLIFLMAGRSDPTELAINTKLVKPDEIKSYRDLLAPKWRGKVVTWHPVLHPIAEAGMMSLFYNDLLGPEWFRQFYSEQKPFFVTEDRMFQDAIISGSHPIGLFTGPMKSAIMELGEEGFPVAIMIGTPGVGLQAEAPRIGIGGSGALAVVNRPAKPNTQKLFINWYLSREGQWWLQEVRGEYESFRADISNENVMPPFRLPKKGPLHVKDADPGSQRLRKDMHQWFEKFFATR